MTQQRFKKSKFDSCFDEWQFLETYMTDYSHSDDIASIDDIDCYLANGRNHPDYASGRFAWVEDYNSKSLLQVERNKLMRVCLEEALTNYIDKHYPLR